MEDKETIFFDGVCNLCNNSVNFIIDRDPANHFNFASLQSDFAKQSLSSFPIDESKLDSIILLKDKKVYTKSSAALHIARKLNGGWKLLFGLMIIPKFIRDLFYDLIAINRYRLFGKLEECRIPTPELRGKFLD